MVVNWKVSSLRAGEKYPSSELNETPKSSGRKVKSCCGDDCPGSEADLFTTCKQNNYFKIH